MGTTNYILNYALTRNIFTRKELITDFEKTSRIGSPNSLSEQLARLLKSGQLIRVDRGIYKLSDNGKPAFSVVYSKKMKRINQKIKDRFPFIDYCLWSASVLIPYMHHVPNINILLIDVEREVAEAVFNSLTTDIKQRIFLMPSLVDFDRYINTNEAIIIRPLISESPLQHIDGTTIPTIEKILVDIVVDVEFTFLQGAEINDVYTSVFERHNINKNKLLRYAARRGRKEEVLRLLNTNKL